MLTRMLVLWVLAEGPLHGYRIQRALEEGALGAWFPIHAASIYSMLRTLGKEGFVREGATARDGARPARTTYAITRAGREELRGLLRRAWVELPAPGTPFHVALMSAADLDPAELATLRAARRKAIAERRSALDRDVRALPAAAMVGRERAHLEAEERWLDGLCAKDLGPRMGGR